ncbi:MAG TPA: BfmA/BtgA family mobilization protein, partial [Bacteroidia bacterium]
KLVCKTFDLTLGEFVLHSAAYFRKTGIDPSASGIESPYKAIKELEKRIGQVVAYIKNHEQEKLDPLLEQMIIVSRRLEESLKKLPASERFDQVIKGVNHHANLLVDNHKKQMDHLRESHQKISDEAKREMKALTEAVRHLQAGQAEIKEVINTKLSKKVFG